MALLALSALTIAACGSSGSSGAPKSSGTTTSSSGSSAAAKVAAAKSAVATLSTSKLDFPFPTAPVQPGSHKVAIVAVGLAAFGTQTLSTYLQQAVTAIGWTAPPTYDGKFSPTTESGLIEQAVNSGAQALILEAINPQSVTNAISLANSKNIPIVCINCGPDLPSGIINIEMSPQKVGIAQADYVIAQSNGTAKVWLDDDTEFAESALQIQTAKSTLGQDCPNCQVHEIQSLSTDLKQPGIPVFSSLLSAQPAGTIDWVISYSDSAALPFATLAQQGGRTEISFMGFQAAPPYVAAIAKKDPVGAKASVAISIPFFAYAAMDELARTFTHQSLWDASQLPVGIIDSADLSMFDATAPFVAPNFDFVSKFKNLWGKV